jgi:hypothetical protein
MHPLEFELADNGYIDINRKVERKTESVARNVLIMIMNRSPL